MLLNVENEIDQWHKIKVFLDTNLGRDVGKEIIPTTILESFEKYKEELEIASKYIQENEVIHLKVKKNVPTVIEYQGRRYVLDTKGGPKK